MIIFRSFILRMRNVSDKSFRGNKNTILFSVFWCRIHLLFRLMGGLYGKSMTSPFQIPGSPSRLRSQHRKLTAMRYYGNVMTTTIWRLRILHLQQYSRRLDLFFCFFLKSWRLWDNVEKYCSEGHATDDSMAHAHCMLKNCGYKHTLTLCNTYRISTTTMAARTRLSVTLYVHCLSCLMFRFNFHVVINKDCIQKTLATY